MRPQDYALARLLHAGRDLPAQTTAYGDEPDQVLEVHGPEEARTLVVVHGGYFRPGTDRTHARPQARALAQEGWRVVLAEYRRTPGAPSETTDDLTALDAHLREHDHEVAAWVGHSAGGTLALWRALHPDLPPARALALAPLADLDAAVAEDLGEGAVRDWVGGGPQEDPAAYDRLDPTRLVRSNPAAAERIHVLHGDHDETVPLRQSEHLPVPRTVLRGAHHFDPVDPESPHWPRALEVIRRG